MIFCSACNYYNEPDSIFCQNCGKKLDGPSDLDSSSQNNPQINHSDQNRIDLSSISTNPLNLKIISLYELILSFILLIFGYNIFIHANDRENFPAYARYANDPLVNQIQIIGIIVIVIAIIGFLAGIFLYIKKKIGYHLSQIFLVITGIGFFWYWLLTTFAMILSFIYFNSDESIEFIFKKSHPIHQS